MHCESCGFENPPTMNFCGECGTKLRLSCPQCGAENPPGFKFCGQCGAGLAIGATRQVAPTTDTGQVPLHPEPQIQRYTPKHLAEKILQSRSALEGERKQITILFADIKGSMELLAGLDPEEARRLLDPVLHAMMEAVHRYEGTVNQVLGDGIMALFGAPLAHEDHAVRACYAALTMQEAIRRYTEEVRYQHGIEVQIRVGLNSGEVVVRTIGNDLHMDYSAIGQTTHLAARMEQLATPGTIRLTMNTLRLAEDFIQVKSLGLVLVKGLQDPVEVFELVGAGPVRRRLQASLARGFTRFVGRQQELETLRQALEQAGRGQGQVVALVGEPGIGKSRLFYEFTRSHRTKGWLWLESSSVSYGKATAYLPVIDLLKAYFQIEDRDDVRRIREKVMGKILALDEALRPTLPALLSLLGVPMEDTSWKQLDPPQRRQRTLEAIKRLLLRESQIQPLLLVFEDLHWIDTETQAFLDSLIEGLPTARILLLVNYRPEYQHGWGSKTYCTQLRLDPLPSESVEELLQALLGNDASLQPLRPSLMERTEGNPFFLEESIRTLVETQALVGERGAYRLVKALPTLQMPGTVQAMLAARIDRLPPEEKHLLQCAAVIGKDVEFWLLQAIAELPEEALRRGLLHLQTAEFLYETSLFPDLEYTFKHALTHEVAYGSLLQERRRILHNQILRALETRSSDRLDENVERLAYHAQRGEVWDKALIYFRQAGSKAAARSANREAVSCFEQALVALQHLPESRDMLEQAIDLRFDLRNALFPLGKYEQILNFLREAETLAKTLDDQRRLGWVSSYMTHYFWWRGKLDQAAESGQRALAIATTFQDFGLQVATNLFLGQVYYNLGNYPQAMEFLRKNVESLQGDLIYERFNVATLPFVVSRHWLIRCLAEVGEFTEGRIRAEEAFQVAEAANDSLGLFAAYYGTGFLYLHKGEFQKAISLFERGLAFSQTWNISFFLHYINSALGYTYVLSGRVAEAIPLLERAVEQMVSMKTMGGLSLLVGWLSESYLLVGRRSLALELALHALDLSRNHKERGHEAWALRLLGEIHAHQAPPHVEEAEDYYRQAFGLAEELGMRPLVAHVHFGLGSLHHKVGRSEEARAELSQTIELFRSMEMTFWLNRAEAIFVGS
ncbi:MAG TPA: adenylate/guanylate cyclase domain-containing protein [Candidatus Limnocylindrales bacterium]|nr:adenylate/guanylate cyclase domain-containing protein [Candidatus Limnocylindrales bacterium]